MTTAATVAPAANYARPLATGQRGGQLASASAPHAPLRPEYCTLPSLLDQSAACPRTRRFELARNADLIQLYCAV